MLQNFDTTLGLDGFFGLTSRVENRHEVWKLGSLQSLMVYVQRNQLHGKSQRGQSWHPACTLSCLPRMVISVLVQGESWEPDDFQN